jgi:hypothetical protein
MNDWLVQWGLEAWKPALRALVMPPVPMLLLVLLGLTLVRRRPWRGRSLGVVGVLATWVICTPWAGHVLQTALTQPPPPLAAPQIAALRQAPRTACSSAITGSTRWPSARSTSRLGWGALTPAVVGRALASISARAASTSASVRLRAKVWPGPMPSASHRLADTVCPAMPSGLCSNRWSLPSNCPRSCQTPGRVMCWR